MKPFVWISNGHFWVSTKTPWGDPDQDYPNTDPRGYDTLPEAFDAALHAVTLNPS